MPGLFFRTPSLLAAIPPGPPASVSAYHGKPHKISSAGRTCTLQAHPPQASTYCAAMDTAVFTHLLKISHNTYLAIFYAFQKIIVLSPKFSRSLPFPPDPSCVKAQSVITISLSYLFPIVSSLSFIPCIVAIAT